VDDGLALMLAQGGLDGRLVTNITSDQGQFSSSDLLNPSKCFWMAVAEIVENNDFMAGLKEFDTGVRADISSATCYENAHTSPPAWVASSMATAPRVSAPEPESLPAKHVGPMPVVTFLN
jgi:hypothetical protein